MGFDNKAIDIFLPLGLADTYALQNVLQTHVLFYHLVLFHRNIKDYQSLLHHHMLLNNQ